jgi:phosphopantetheinyl transferase
MIKINCNHRREQFTASLAFVESTMDDDDYNECKKWLHPDELAYLSSLQFPRRRHSYLLGRLAAKKALRDFLPESPSHSLVLEAGIFGQPVLKGFGASGVQVSIAHKEGIAAAIACSERHPLAIDIEKLETSQHAAIFNMLTAREKRHFFPHSDGEIDNNLYALLWTAKESLAKILRIGFTAAMEIFEVDQITWTDDRFWVTSYTHFPQYKSISFDQHGITVAIAMPKLSKFHLKTAMFD